ncbi:hypothetical protein G2W53_044929 [Senna tora]|uniref:Uncharacterized protein n=1 Tax=Senna tora TaxID=362788 RepID=A0A834VWW6_9FABA|nr:hypothetical protein G2W53_044929 [Senna tora]
MSDDLSVKVRVVRLWFMPPYNDNGPSSASTGVQIQMALCDRENNTIAATVKSIYLNKFKSVLKDGGVYVLSKFASGISGANFRVTNNKMKRLSKKAKSCVDGQPIGRTHLPPQSTSVGASIQNLGTINQLGDSSSLHSPQHDPPTLPTTQDDTSTLPTNHNASTNDQESPKYRKYWVVDVVDEQGLTKETHLRVHDAWGLPPGQRVVVPWNNIGQPIGEGGGLLAIFLGTVAMDFTLFPISYAMWTTMPNVYKNEVYKNTVQAKFVVDDGQHKRFILQSIGKKWRARRGKLYKMYDTSKTREENIANPPLGLTREQWASFIDYRNDPKNQEKSKKNKKNRKKQNIPHTGGSKSIARKRAEMEIEKGALVSRGDVWTATHKEEMDLLSMMKLD